MRRYYFYEKNDFPNIHQISMFKDSVSEKTRFLHQCLPVGHLSSIVCEHDNFRKNYSLF